MEWGANAGFTVWTLLVCAMIVEGERRRRYMPDGVAT